MRLRMRRRWWTRVELSCGRSRACGRQLLLRPRMEGMSSGCRLGAGGWECPVVTWRPGGPIWSAGGGGRRGAVAFSFRAWLGRGPAICEVAWVGVCGGSQFAWAAFRGRGGWAWVFWGLRGGRVRATGWGGRAAGRGLPSVGVCGLSSVGGGEGCLADGSVAGVCWCSGGWGVPVSRGPGVRDGGRVWVSGGAARGEGHGRGLRGGMCCVVVCVRSQRRACVVSCRLGSLEEKLAVFCCRGKDFTDELAYLVDLLVSGGKGVC